MSDQLFTADELAMVMPLLSRGFRLLTPGSRWVDITCNKCDRPPGSYLHTMPDIAKSEFHEFAAAGR